MSSDGFDYEVEMMVPNNNDSADAENQNQAIEDTVEKGPLKPISETTVTERIVSIFSFITVGTALLAMILNQTIFVLGAGACACLVGPLVYYQQTKITDVKALRETHKALDNEVDHLASENKRLEENVEELGTIVEELEDVENAFEILTESQDQSTAALQKEVKKNRDILKAMTVHLKNSIAQNLIDVVMASDEDHDETIDEEEAPQLLKRVYNITGVTIEVADFMQAMNARGHSLRTVIDLVLENIFSQDNQRRMFQSLAASTDVSTPDLT